MRFHALERLQPESQERLIYVREGPPFLLDRRRFAASATAAALFPSSVLHPAAAAAAALTSEEVKLLSTAESYEVVASSSKRLSPSVRRIPPAGVTDRLKGKRAVFLGEHHNSGPDHLLQAGIIRQLRPTRSSMAVGLEAVQQRFQPVLDDYVNGRIDEQQLEAAVEWRKRWFWPFAAYEPVFRACRELTAAGMHTPLVALNVDSEDLSQVEIGGLPALGRSVLARYIPDAEGFGAFAGTTAFKEYSDYIIRPSYIMHQRMGILRTTITGQQLEQDMSFRNFFSGRILWDEAMGSRSAAWCKAHPDGLFVGLVGSDHVKFGCGIPARCARQLGTREAVSTVMLNPKPIDTSDDPSDRPLRARDGLVDFTDFTLQLRFSAVAGDGGPPIIGGKPEDRKLAFAMSQTRSADEAVLPLADFIVFSRRTPTRQGDTLATEWRWKERQSGAAERDSAAGDRPFLTDRAIQQA